MNFFKSILSDDPDPPQSPNNTLIDDGMDDQPSSLSPGSATIGSGGAWSFGGLIQTLTTQSESVIEIYRRDLKEFRSGFLKETATFRDVASRAVKDLPMEIDGVLKSTANIISHGTDSPLATSHSEPDPEPRNSTSKRYSRYDSQLRAIESDVNTYCLEPEDLEDFEKWKLGFELKREENQTIEGIYKRAVPNLVDDETFWYRYFYKVHKLKQQEEAMAKLVKRASFVDLDEELSWDVDDDEDDVDDSVKIKELAQNKDMVSEIDKKGEILDKEIEENKDLVSKVDEEGENEPNLEKGSDKVSTSGNTQREEVNTKGDKDSDVSIVSTQPPLPVEEDMGWDEIEDVESGDEKKVAFSENPNRTDFRKRLNVAEVYDEDLSWDIEDDDEPVAISNAK